jgi:hypothetical protein
MLLSEYVKSLDSKEFNYYKDTTHLADTSQAGYKDIGNFQLPPLDFIKKITTQPRADGTDLENTYTYGRHVLLDAWAEKTFPELKYKQTLVQLQKPGEKVDPHVDTLHGQIKNWIKQEPALANIEHSMENPNPNFQAKRYFMGVEDHIKGQEFILNGKQWIWKKGDCISLNVWRGIHNTINNSSKDRYIIKITGLKK